MSYSPPQPPPTKKQLICQVWLAKGKGISVERKKKTSKFFFFFFKFKDKSAMLEQFLLFGDLSHLLPPHFMEM